MSQRDTKFGKAVSKLKPPSSDTYSQSDYDAAFLASDQTETDKRLYEAAKWLALEANAGRNAFANPMLDALNPTWSTILAVAAHNREYRTATDLATEEAKRAREAGTMSWDVLTRLRVEGIGGQQFTATDIAQTGADLTENWLFDASKTTGTAEATGDLIQTATIATLAFSFRKAVNTLWNEAWWDGWYCETDNTDLTRWRPRDQEFEKLIQAWSMRQEANLMNYPNTDRITWPKLKPAMRRHVSRTKGVVDIMGIGPSQKITVTTLPYLSRYMPAYALEKSALEGVYLADFMNVEMPKYKGISAARLLLAWHVIYDIATLLAKRSHLPISTLSATHARELSLAVERKPLTKAVAQALQTSAETAEVLVEFLTFQFQTGGKAKAKGNKGLWAAPLVPVPGTETFVLPLSVLATSNPARRVEAWLEKGGIDDSNPITWSAADRGVAFGEIVPPSTESRGDRYETIYRHRVCEAIQQNPKFATASYARHEIKKSKSFPEQVDLLVAFGGLCLVGEVKFFLMPTDAHERARYDEKLLGAANQAKNKLKALQSQPEVMSSALGIEIEEAKKLKMMPVVVTAQGYRFSTRVDDVLILDATFLLTYLSGSDLVIGMALVPATGECVQRKITLYSSEKAAANIFEGTMEEPLVLARYLEKIGWDESPLPTLHHRAAIIEMAVVQDTEGFDKMQEEAMAAALKPKR